MCFSSDNHRQCKNQTLTLSSWGLFFLYIFAPATLATAQIADTTLIQLLDSRMDGRRALKDVAYYSQFWRIAGSPSFDQCLDHTVESLKRAGFSPEPDAPFRYWIDEEPLAVPVWIPSGGTLHLEKPERRQLHTFEDTPIFLCRNSFSTRMTGELVFVGGGDQEKDYTAVDVRGKIVLGEADPRELYLKAVVEHGARGVLSAYMADYNRPDLFPDAIHDGEIPYDPERRSFGLMVSRRTLKLLKASLDKRLPVQIAVHVETTFQMGERRTLGAEIKGQSRPGERIVLIAHMDHYNPGANDNASGAATVLEMARTIATLITERQLPAPERTLTFLWVDEYDGTKLWMGQHAEDVKTVLAAIALDMVGERTAITGGPFRVERMPDPSAIWTRPPDEHTAWGAGKVDRQMVRGHFLNDFYLAICQQYSDATGWPIATNPWEGGSDHDLFLDRNIPALLNWHFPDYFYHTSLDALDKVDPDELRHVGVVAAAAVLTFASAQEVTALRLMDAIVVSAEKRFTNEARNSREAILRVPNDSQRIQQETEERSILMAWAEWYIQALDSVWGFPVGETGETFSIRLERAKQRIGKQLSRALGIVSATTERLEKLQE